MSGLRREAHSLRMAVRTPRLPTTVPPCEMTVGRTGASSGDWSCSCGFRRPQLDAWLDGDELVSSDGRRLGLRLMLPGRCNRANAAMAAQCANALGVFRRVRALEAMAEVGDVEGRFATVDFGGSSVRLLLAKNPAGWAELLDLYASVPTRS